ncbi:MAG TPA: ABC transporter permease [Ramlibacter sp.]|uniref:ABC transporter permease n=1 Tax=Ramlibacter sp. TaxID=1917967 RepID=UPI002CF10A15|nr:ABC transporter permease [Ramlibacter sp.]HVZ46641.1 ABC transporter permease [Ramlibacter sp.]
MKSIALAFRYLWSRPLAALLNLLLLTLGLASITFVVLVSHQVNRAFDRDLAGIDAVVGAKGSPLQLIMAAVFQIDVPPGNVPLAQVQKLAALPQLERVIPLALGDSYRGYRLVGTTAAYLDHYRVRVAQGELWRRSMHAVIGAEVAKATGMQPGAKFSAVHGFSATGDTHDEAPFEVMGVLAPCNCVLDRLILTTVESVWRLHEKKPEAKPGLRLAPSFSMAPPAAASAPDAAASAPLAAASAVDAGAAGSEEKPEQPQPEVTAALVTYKSAQAAAGFVRYVNTQTTMQAASPRVEVDRVLRLMGVGTEVLRGLGAVLLLTAALSVFVALWNAVRERRMDLAMLRMLGATPTKVSVLLLCEAFWLALLASILGLALGHGLTAIVGYLLQAQQSLPVTGAQWVAAEAWIPFAALVTALIAALTPAISAYRLDAATMLNVR